LGSGVATFLATPSSANLASAVTDETGTGALVFANSPTLVTPALGTPASGVVTNLTGTASININGTVGATTATTGAFTTLSASGDVTLSGGTANGVAYLNGSKVLTTGSALTFDGTNFSSTGTATVNSANSSQVALVVKGETGNGIRQNFIGQASSGQYNWQIGASITAAGYFAIIPSTAVDGTTFSTAAYSITGTGTSIWAVGGSEAMRLTSTSLYTASGINVGIGTSSPAEKLQINDGRMRFLESGQRQYNIGIVAGTPNFAITDATFSYNPFLIDGSGNVGIGTSSPSYKLDVNTSGGAQATARLYGNDQANVRLRLENAGSGGRTWELVGGLPGANNSNFSIRDVTGSTTPLTIDSSGNLGIGTSSPGAKLDVNGQSRFGGVLQITGGGVPVSGGGMELAGSTSDSSITSFNRSLGTYLTQFFNALEYSFATSGTERMRLTSTGLGIGTSSPGAKLHTSSSGLGDGGGIRIQNTGSGGAAFSIWPTATINGEGAGKLIITGPGGNAVALDSSGNLGIGTSSITAGFKLDVNGNARIGSGSAQGLEIQPGALTYISAYNRTTSVYTPLDVSGEYLRFSTNNGAERMRLDSSGNLGIGTSSPAAKLGVAGAIVSQATAYTAGTVGATFGYYSSGTYPITYLQMPPSGGFQLWGSDTAARLTVDTSGNLGLGVTPSAWFSTIKALQIGSVGGAFISGNTSAGGSATIGLNMYFDAAAATARYGASSFASRYTQLNGAHEWYTAPSGTAGNAISFTQAMTLTAGGFLGVGVTSPNNYLAVGINTANTGIDLQSTSTGSTYARFGLVGPIGTNNDTYIGSISNNNFLFISNNTERARIDSSGNFMVGTTSPANTGVKLTVSGTGSASTAYVGGASNVTAGQQGGTIVIRDTTSASGVEGMSGVAMTSGPGTDFRIGKYWSGSGSPRFVIGDSGAALGTDFLSIDPSGKLLVGLTSATGVALLQVSGPIRTTGYTVATLPAGTVGMRTYVTDALAPSFGVAVAGSGAVTIPVFYDGANWIVA
jgi:hypothetical protein